MKRKRKSSLSEDALEAMMTVLLTQLGPKKFAEMASTVVDKLACPTADASQVERDCYGALDAYRALENEMDDAWSPAPGDFDYVE